MSAAAQKGRVPVNVAVLAREAVAEAKLRGATVTEQFAIAEAMATCAAVLCDVATRCANKVACDQSADEETRREVAAYVERRATEQRATRMVRCEQRSIHAEKLDDEFTRRSFDTKAEVKADEARVARLGLRLDALHGLVDAGGPPEAAAIALSYFGTAWVALQRLGLADCERLELHFVGASRKEGGDDVASATRLFGPLVKLLAQQQKPPKHVSLALIGPEIPNALDGRSAQLGTDSLPFTLTASWSTDLYHEWWARRVAADCCAVKPTAVFLNNSGLWLFEEWEPTIALVYSELRRPLLATSYSLFESLRELCAFKAAHAVDNWAWRPEMNAFPLVRPGPEEGGLAGCPLNANSYYQCVWLDAKPPYSFDRPLQSLRALGLAQAAKDEELHDQAPPTTSTVHVHAHVAADTDAATDDVTVD